MKVQEYNQPGHFPQFLEKFGYLLLELAKICGKYVKIPKYVKWSQKWAEYLKNIFHIFT